MTSTTAALVLFAACFGLWLLLSPHPTPLGLSLGAAAAALVTILNRHEQRVSAAIVAAPRVLAYMPWLLKEIVIANLQVARIVLHPRLPIDPVVVRFEAPFRNELALTTFGNSITLTPGTITLDVSGSELTVHALTAKGAAALLEGAMARRVGEVFRDDGA